MRIHIITNLFAPDELAGAALFTDLACFLRDRGHTVHVTCTFSYYPAWRLRPEDRGKVWRDEVFQGIRVRRVAMHVPKTPTALGRLRADASFFFSLVRRGRFAQWQPEVVLTAIPLLSQSLAQRFIYLGQGIPRLIVVQDFVVEAALELRMLRVPGLAWVLHGLQRWALRSARTLLTISPDMVDKLRNVVGPDRQTGYVPNWIHESLQREIDRQAAGTTLRHAGVLLYAGNLGVKQGLPDFLTQFRGACACSLGWRLEIFGGGAERDRLAVEIERTPGTRLGPVLQEAEYIRSLLAASACLVTQRPAMGANFLPSKLLPALATGTPVLAVCDSACPLGREVLEGGFGEVVKPGDPAALAQTLQRWKANPDLLIRMSARSHERAKNYHRNLVLPQYEKELLALTHKTTL